MKQRLGFHIYHFTWLKIAVKQAERKRFLSSSKSSAAFVVKQQKVNNAFYSDCNDIHDL